MGTFETLRDEGEHFVHVQQYKRAIDSFTKALEMKEDDPTCLVIRAKCYLMLGNAEAALEDADHALKYEDENGTKDIRALLVKAESLYQKGDFETALVYYHRGDKLRHELKDFRLGIQKSQEAINNSIGEPDSVKLETTGDLSFFHRQEEQKQGYYKPQQKKEEKKERNRPQTASDPKTTKQLLGNLFQDKQFLESLFDEMTSNNTDTGEFVKGRACDGLEYLHSRSDFWRQQKPMYARKRDRQRQDEKLMRKTDKESTGNPVQYILDRLEQIDDAIAKGHYEESLKKCKHLMNKLKSWTENDVKNKEEYVANVYSCIGNANLEMNKLDLALENHEKDLKIADEHDLTDARSRALDNIGRVYARKGHYQKAIDIWLEKVKLSKTSLESTWLYHEIGRCYFEMKKYQEAKEYGEKSLSAAKEASDEGWQLHACVLVAQSEVKCGEFQAGVVSFEQALEMARNQKDKSAEKAIQNALDDVNQQIVSGVVQSETQQKEDKSDSDGEKKKSDRPSSSSSSSSSSSKKSSSGNVDFDSEV
ncbi:hypothetical protein LOTGIDRAFT_140423 [Lottia gigantea]|uniref:Outer dynein arm-docking complex subunit 4 n=1 Tax=Lottia gigantea TaxID=225164 RepID=V4AU95_LOTGI|nr:hypothetical protein LOTGIDRAFT_140423 [Lottia gigantea]ESP00853.1 hypothetical protein LOTGIDRAFT_140423 [Lottia gigantea]